MRALFVAGTDTGVGKTVVTGLLGRFLCVRGYRVVTQKWVQTGCSGLSGDMDVHLEWMGKTGRDYTRYLPEMTPYRFRLAASPHLAARSEGRRIDVEKIRKSFRVLAGNFDFVIVEGVGGLLVPLDARRMFADVVREMKLPVLLVAANRLGAINHTLLSLEALKGRRIKTLGVVFNNVPEGTNRKILEDNPRIVRRLSGGERLLGVLPRLKDPRRLQRCFTKIGEKILAELN